MANRRQYRKASHKGYSARKMKKRDVYERFLIVCEGEKTEPHYFKSFRVPKDVIDIYGFGYNPTRLVKKAIHLKKHDGDYDQVWCVFDRDSVPQTQFKAALTLAKNNDIQVAYSNEAFELWYLLHFNFYQTAVPRSDYIKKLSKLMGQKYKKNSETIYQELETRQPTAIKNAKRLLKQYHPRRPTHDNPSTTVHLLVEELNRFIRK